MRKTYLIGLGIGAVLGMIWMLTLRSLFSREYIIQTAATLSRPVVFMFLLLATIGGAVFYFLKLED